MLEPRDVLERYAALTRRGEIEAAAAVAVAATESNPDDGSGWVALGMIRYHLQELAGARDALETAGMLVPLDAPTRLILGECFARTGHPGLAKHVFETLADDDRTAEGMLPAVAAGLGFLGEYGSALKVCLDLTRRNPDLAEAHFGVAFYLRKLGRLPKAVLPVVARAHELAPEVPLYRISLATLLDHVGRRDEARDLLRGVDLDAVSCRCCVQRMTAIFFPSPASNPPEPRSPGED